MLTKLVPDSLRADAQADGAAVQLFEWLALMEAVGYEDLDFLSIFSEIMGESAESVLGAKTLLLPLPYADKRLVVMPLSEWSGRHSVRHGDILCVHTAGSAEGFYSAEKIASFFDVVKTMPDLMACLSWRCHDRDVSRVARCGSVAQQIAWRWHSPDPAIAVHCGLFFSPQWTPGVSAHVARVIVNYVQTLAPGIQGDRLSFQLEREL